MSVLKPCLLCEGEAKLLRRSGRAGIACPSKWYRERVECKVCGLTTREYKRPGSAFRSWNKRPRPTPARCDELVTIGAAYLGKFFPRKNKAMWPDGAHEIVTRQNAEEVIAAERAEKEKLEAAWLEAEGIISDLKADNAAKDREIERLTKSLIVEEQLNAAKDARIDEYETGLVQMHQEMSALEADNKRLREALEMIAAPAIFFLSRKDAIEMRDTARTALARNAGGNDVE